MKYRTPVPTDADLSFIHPAPTKLIHPSLLADKFYHLVIDENRGGTRNVRGDSFSVSYVLSPSAEEEAKLAGKQLFPGQKLFRGDPFEVNVKGVVFTIRDKMIVQDSQSNEPLAIILKTKWNSSHNQNRDYKIYLFDPCIENQLPRKDQNHEGRSLYEWAHVMYRMTCKLSCSTFCINMKTADGVQYVGELVGPVFARIQMRITRNGKPAVHFLSRPNPCSFSNKWEIKIGPGIDPVLIVAYVAIVDEMFEDF